MRIQRTPEATYVHHGEGEGPFLTERMDRFTLAFLEAALWSSNDESDPAGGVPLDQNYGIEDIAPETLDRLKADCERFQASQAWQAALEDESGDPRADRRQGYGCSVEESGGHDFWFTRCGHGAGFWDGDWKEPHASALNVFPALKDGDFCGAA